MSLRETNAEIDAAAAEWAVRLDGGCLDVAEQAELDAWIAQDNRRLGAFARARAVLAHSKRAKALGPGFDPVALAGPSTHPAKPALSRRRVLQLTGAGAAAAAGLGVLAVGMQAAAKTYRTGRGEIRLIPLEDGSSVTLNTASEIRVSFGGEQRRIDMIIGEALFDVVKDAEYPLQVYAGETCIQGAGASFTVSKLEKAPVQVLVRRGVVEVQKSSAPAQTGQLVAANTLAAFTGDQPQRQEVLPPAEVSRQLAWREGMLSFEDKPLGRAAEEFARYSGTRIRFADPEIAAETVTGLYAANNPTGFAEAVAVGLGLQVHVTSDSVVLYR